MTANRRINILYVVSLRLIVAFPFDEPIQSQREVISDFDERQDAAAEEKRRRAAEGN